MRDNIIGGGGHVFVFLNPPYYIYTFRLTSSRMPNILCTCGKFHHNLNQCFIHRSIEIPFGDKDQKGDYTLDVGDLVEFKIATDRRDKLQRATQIALVLDTFKVNTEQRETVSILIITSMYYQYHSIKLLLGGGHSAKTDFRCILCY